MTSMETALREFDFSIAPFNLLTREQAVALGRRIDIGYEPEGSRVLETGTASNYLYMILKGHVAAIDPREGDPEPRTFAEYGPGDLFGSMACLTGRSRHRYVTLEDALLWTIPADAFREAVEANGRFAAYFLDSLSRKAAMGEASESQSDLGELMLTRVGEAELAEAVIVPADTTIAEATRRMRDRRVNCVFVDTPHELGIATRTDVLDAIVLADRSLSDPVVQIATVPIVTCDSQAPLFQALVSMTRHRIERVAVTRHGQLVGTLGLAEVLSHYSSHSHIVGLRVARARTREELAEAAAGLTPLVRTLYATGAKMRHLGELVSALNARILARLYAITVPAELQDRMCMMVLGSEGRSEQILKTDQDNALILGEGVTDAEVEPYAMALFEGLVALGYPPCPGGVMVSNTEWRGSVPEWQAHVERLVASTAPQSQLDTAILIDAQPVAGDPVLFHPLRESLSKLGQNQIWLHHFVRPAIEFHTPLTMRNLFGREAAVDIKYGGIFPVVHGLRSLAVEHGLAVTNSFERAAQLSERGVLSAQLSADVQQALAVMLRLRLGQQLESTQEGVVPDNRIDLRKLRRLDRELLRDALRVVKELQSFLGSHYGHGI
jgi:CBS domain-containing protein